MVEDGSFRQDLYYRLNVVPLWLPPLRERPSDVPALVHRFLATRRRADESGPRRVSHDALQALEGYAWPGNVRELRNLVERLVVMVEEDTIRVEHLPAHIAGGVPSEGRTVPRTNAELKALKRTLRARAFEDLERQFVLDALRRSDWNVSRAARETGVQRSNFHALMRRHGIRSKSVRED
jgi:DNA-binding NtrC family response regulator